MDFKPVVKEAYLGVIKGACNRVLHFEVDDSINSLLRLLIVEPPKADEVLLITDKFFLYQALWKATLELLYEEFLPLFPYEHTWQMEVTPYTMLLCELTAELATTRELDDLQTLTQITDEQLEFDFQDVAEKTGLTRLGFGNGLANLLPPSLLPRTRREELLLLFRLMNFPPLTELALFQNRYNAALRHQFERLAIAFSAVEKVQAPSFGMPEALRNSYFPVDHELFKRYGLTGFEQEPELTSFKEDFAAIRRLAAANKAHFRDDVICPCCGDKTTIEVPEEVLQYKYLVDNKKLGIAIGLLHLQEFRDNYTQNLAKHLNQFLPELNRIDNPECLILVEGESEEIAIPILAFRKHFILSQRGIQVYNSKSKEKLAADFLTFRAKYPNRKMICLLDSDAKKERDNIERIVKDNKHKYRMVFIEQGTFEDLFELPYAVQTLNELYPDGEEILVSDFDTTKDFLSNVKRIMFQKKQATFDKVAFAKLISLRVDVDQLPTEINQILDIAQDFTRATTYFKNR
ncbi:hypothetical protein ABIB60_003905 [Hymenobacter sp. UYP22]